MSLTSAFVGNLMRALTTVSGLALWVSAVAAAQTTTACETVLTPSYTSPVVAPGWKAALVAKGLTKPRGIIFDRKGRLLVVQQGVGVTRLDLVDHGDTCIWMSTSETILSDSQGVSYSQSRFLSFSFTASVCVSVVVSFFIFFSFFSSFFPKDYINSHASPPFSSGGALFLQQDQFGYNHGIEISADGRMLLVSTSEAVHAWLYDSERGRITKDSMRVLIRNMTSAGHVTRSLLLTRNQPPPSNPGDDGEEMPPRTYLLVSRGSSANVDTLAGDATSGISQIRAFDVAELYQATTPVDYASGGRLVGWGLRNSVGMGEHPATGSIWSVENSADDMARAGQDVHQDNPGEELNYHGTVESIFSEKADEALESKNRNYGYPFCYALWNTTDFPELGELKVGDQFMSNPDSKTGDQKCADEFISPRLTFQAHMAPLDIKFDPKNNGSRVFISFRKCFSCRHYLPSLLWTGKVSLSDDN